MATLLIPARPAGAPAREQFESVPLESLKVGVTLNVPVYEDRSDGSLILLLASGTALTESLLARLKIRGIERVRVHRGELQRVVAGFGDKVSSPSQPANSRWKHTSASFLNKVATHGVSRYDDANRELLGRVFQSSVKQVETLFDGLSRGEISDTAPLAAVSSESLLRIADDLDLFVSLGLKPATDKYPCRHSLQTAMLAMSIGTVLGLKRDELIELGIGCLVHDAGMLQLQSSIVNVQRALTSVEFLEITRHPTLTFDALRYVADVPNASRLVAYQMHERLNGSGYPRRRTANQIHYLAKIAAVADVFVALLAPRPHRPGLLPYRAMEQILQEAHAGLYDPAVVRALLHTVSLFPIGSYVEISDGRVGKVLRSNRDSYAAPVIETGANRDSRKLELIDLSHHRDLKVVRAVPAAQA
jgi:HD-GYP domain-containing protein (c-di-GMP phosphodiesterase class II)